MTTLYLLLIIVGGIVFVGGLLFLYRFMLRSAQRRKGNPLSSSIAGNAAAAPLAVSEPARRARLDDLRRSFESGVDKFHAAGKNLYAIPWYVLVGEPGSGKTEAIRHCNVGFPPGLQDTLQGAGGTLNMNWWFTNHAVILDTAGRLMFEEVPAGSTNEWTEFLKLLKTNRPNCPINGMLLVIPVDTLIKDSADAIEKKAGKIAQQFDQIQRALGVRFPVFIVISKCDLLNGFREFFDDLNDPQLQHQMMGWSNPASLDDKFDPAGLQAHLETVKHRLVDRRRRLLLDPINSEDPQGRRLDQVDALYALPDSITKITPRLQRYLELIFTAGEWSPKPLFFRGIYFTSSLTEGSALDAELAEVLGVPVDSLPEGRVWRRDRAYFLRDLFIDKIFREKGLVTRAANALQQQRARRMMLAGSGVLAILLLLVLTFLGYRSLTRNLGEHRAYWSAAAQFDPGLMQIVNTRKDNAYNTDAISLSVGDKKEATVAELLSSILPAVQTPIHIPLMFRPMTFLSADLNAQRTAAYRALYERTVLYPLYSAARTKILDSTTVWSNEADAALVELMKLDPAHVPLKTDPHPQVALDPLFKFVLPAADYSKAAADIPDLQKAADWLYANSQGWPPAILQPGAPTSGAAIYAGQQKSKAFDAAGHKPAAAGAAN